MKKILTFSILMAIMVVWTGITSCGDGAQPTRAFWNSSRGGIGAEFDEGAAIPTLMCVDVTDYRRFTITDTPQGAGPTPGGTSDVANETVGISASKAMTATLMATNNSIKRCIEAEIKTLKQCGSACKFWWNGGWLLTREKRYKPPKNSEVDSVNFESCEQIREANCLITN